MKINGFLTSFLTVVFASVAAHAFDFAADNGHGQVIYYNILSKTDNTAEVTYRDSGYNSYAGDVILPSVAAYNGTEYAVTRIGRNAFRNSSELTSLSIPSSVTVLGSAVYSTSSYAFHGCSSLSSLIIEDGDDPLVCGVDYYGGRGSSATRGLFSACPLENLYLGRTLNCVDDGGDSPDMLAPFAHNSSLASVTTSNSVRGLPAYLFYKCASLERVSLADRIWHVGESAFALCSALKMLSLGESMTEIGVSAFFGCSELMTIYTSAPVPPLCGNQAFDGVDFSACELVVDNSDALQEYAEAETWCLFTNVKVVEVFGDVNGDNMVDASDLASLINIITGISAPSATGDINRDGMVDASDLATVINLIVSQ